MLHQEQSLISRLAFVAVMFSALTVVVLASNAVREQFGPVITIIIP